MMSINEKLAKKNGISKEDFEEPEESTTDVILEILAEQEERLCMIELFGLEE